jgi:hypothetical protein
MSRHSNPPDIFARYEALQHRAEWQGQAPPTDLTCDDLQRVVGVYGCSVMLLERAVPAISRVSALQTIHGLTGGCLQQETSKSATYRVWRRVRRLAYKWAAYPAAACMRT